MDWIKIFDSLQHMKQTLGDKPRLLIVHNKRLCIAVHDDSPLVVSDRCPHNGESLSKGSVNYLGEIVCPWHGYQFHLQTGRECAQRAPDVETIPYE
ncbi:MAG: Rieske 2Fe-2S domain-containing protein [Flammeovirgaceae bacterium]|nr:Rieske 2Fe-2S domain-containing protein [Flammeovirgaceae bacterium]